jgi:hypothetical protein
MTDRNDAMTLDPHDPTMVVEALLDGEPVTASDLRAALADPAAREHLVDLLVLRAAVGLAGTAVPSAATGARRGGRLRWLAAAAALVLSLSAGYLAGQRFAPAPTRVIVLTPGVNWMDRQEGL